MRRNRQNIFMAAALLLMAGCGNDNDGTPPDGGDRVALQVSSGIQTRAYDNFWENGDAIGIYMLKTGTATISESAENRKYTTTDGSNTFTTTADQTVYFPIDNSKVDFVAYYPYQQTLTNGAFALDVSTQTNLPSIDLMTAGVKSTEAEPLDKNHYKVLFKFYHRLTKLELNISTGRGITAEDLKGLKVEVTKQRTSGSYDPQLEIPGVDSEPVQTVELNTNADGTLAQAILLPTTAAGGINDILTGREFIFTLKTTGEVFRWAVPDDKGFERGDKNIYDITINRTGVDVSAKIEKWNEVDNGEIEAE